MPSVEDKLLAVELVDRVGRLLHLRVVEDIDGSLADQVDRGHTVDNVPGFVLALAQSCERNVQNQDKDIESDERIPNKQEKATNISLKSKSY